VRASKVRHINVRNLTLHGCGMKISAARPAHLHSRQSPASSFNPYYYYWLALNC
jgi:hypothetical protein